MKSSRPNRTLFVTCLFFSAYSLFCQVRLPRLISDGMVIQRESRVTVWGWAQPGEQVTVHFMGKSYRTAASADGEWAVRLSPSGAGGPYTMEIAASNRITVKDILIGDVWVCSGQSNMVLPMARVANRYPEEIAQADYPEIRQFLMPVKYDFKTPQPDVQSGSWKPATPQNVPEFSAVAYFFAKFLFEEYRVPVGLINASVGGTPVEAWISEEALSAFPQHLKTLALMKDASYVNQVMAEDQNRANAWYIKARLQDRGYTPGETPWNDEGLDDSSWPSMTIPGYWSDGNLGNVNGVVWFRKEFEVPGAFCGKPSRLFLGRIVDADSVFINGRFVGTTSYQYPPRIYSLPGGLLKPGKNSIVVRVISTLGRGGFVPDKPYEIQCEGGTIGLTGEWKYQLGAALPPLAGPTFFYYKPAGLFNGMITPLLSYAIKGVIWYQGESNTDRAMEYRTLFPALITDWREKWKKPFPFLFVQLPNFMETKETPSESDWALLREAQAKALSVPNTAMAVTIDLGEWNDVHPTGKKEVGRRLALAAREKAYGEKTVVFSGPAVHSVRIKGSRIVIAFDHTGSGLCAKGDTALAYFALAGENRRFVWAHAKIDHRTVTVWSEEVPKPVYVRYAWADNPQGANLYNREGLPASPFRTDE